MELPRQIAPTLASLSDKSLSLPFSSLTKTGNGFSELAEYDSDGNGWIDENDEVYDQLKVWVKDENGKDKLYIGGIGNADN